LIGAAHVSTPYTCWRSLVGAPCAAVTCNVLFDHGPCMMRSGSDYLGQRLRFTSRFTCHFISWLRILRSLI